MKKICGIYKITSPSGKIYIGQSVNINKKFSKYRGLHCESQASLFNSFKKYGVDKHEFEIIHECPRSELNKMEKYYVDLFQTFNSKHGMNLRDGGGSHGRMSAESIEKNRLQNIGRKASLETRRKMSNASLGKKKSKTHKKNIARARTGVRLSREHIESISKSSKGKVISEETKKKISETLKRRKCT